MQKKAAAIHDISGLGKCSLTVALPILSAAGIATAVLPTALLSTHTGGFTGYTYRDLTDDMLPFARHWSCLGMQFDALYSGFLGSFAQLDMVAEIFGLFKNKNNLVVVDPAMADHGQMYSLFDARFAAGMASLCTKADLIVPNITEAFFLLGKAYRPEPYTPAMIEELLKGLACLCPRVVLTGVAFEPGLLGAASLENGRIAYSFAPRVQGVFHGTGDIFASALLGGLLNGLPLPRSSQLAVDFTAAAIRQTVREGTEPRFGVNFEACLPGYSQRLGLQTDWA